MEQKVFAASGRHHPGAAAGESFAGLGSSSPDVQYNEPIRRYAPNLPVRKEGI